MNCKHLKENPYFGHVKSSSPNFDWIFYRHVDNLWLFFLWFLLSISCNYMHTSVIQKWFSMWIYFTPVLRFYTSLKNNVEELALIWTIKLESKSLSKVHLVSEKWLPFLMYLKFCTSSLRVRRQVKGLDSIS